MTVLALGGLIALSVFAPAPAMADMYTLQSGNSTLTVDTAANYGMLTWDLGGVTYMSEQRFFYRIGDSGGEARLDSLASTYTQGSASTLTMAFTSAEFDAEVGLQLYGGDPGEAYLNEFITITNTSGSLLELHFFQYVDFNMSGAGDEMLRFVNAARVEQWGSAGVVGEGVQIYPTPPDHHEAGDNQVLYGSLDDGSPTALSDSPAIGSLTGAPDLAWAFQWDLAIPVEGSYTIIKSKQLHVVPAPGAAVLSMIGLGLLGSVKRRFS